MPKFVVSKGHDAFAYYETVIDAFGGGAHILDLATGETVSWIYTDGWLAEVLQGGDADA